MREAVVILGWRVGEGVWLSCGGAWMWAWARFNGAGRLGSGDAEPTSVRESRAPGCAVQGLVRLRSPGGFFGASALGSVMRIRKRNLFLLSFNSHRHGEGGGPDEELGLLYAPAKPGPLQEALSERRKRHE